MLREGTSLRRAKDGEVLEVGGTGRERLPLLLLLLLEEGGTEEEEECNSE